MKKVRTRGYNGPLPATRIKSESESTSLIQISVDDDKVTERINTFISTKRDQVNQSNRREFRSSDPAVLEVTCARTDTPILNRELQVRTSKVLDNRSLISVEERMKNLEEYLKVLPPLPTDIFERLKNLEERALALEKARVLPYQQDSYSSWDDSDEAPKKKRKKTKK